MLSFYGGRSGQSFSIKQIFSNYTEMLADLDLTLNSSIEVDEYVVIFYGEPGTSDYEKNLTTDKNQGYNNKNASFWQKVFKVVKDGETLGDDYASSMFSTNNIRYHRLGYFPANIPNIKVGTVSKVAPVEMPNVTKNEQSTSDNCILDFDLPKAPRFYLGDLIDIKQLYSLNYGNSCEITNQELYDLCEDGDFYIVKSHQLIYQVISHGPAEGRVVLKYCGQFSMNLDKIDALYIDTYKQNDDGSYSLSDIKINKMSQVSTNTGGAIEKTDVEISIPHIPDFSVDSVQTTEAGTSASAIIKHKDTNTLAFDFTIPKGDTGATGPIGPVGPGFDIIDMIEVTGTNENINETIIAKLNQLYTTKPKSTQIIGVNYIDSSTGSAIASYWYCWTQNTWHSVNAFGGSNLSWKEF